jgi:hypothetical protein
MKILEHNVETGEAIEREATAEEIATAKANVAGATAQRAKAEADATAKAALLEKLGITADEAKLLLV